MDRFFNGSIFLHHKLAMYLRDNYHVIVSEEQLYYYDGVKYVQNNNMLKKYMTQLIPQIKEAQRVETLRTLPHIAPNKEKASPNFIALKNGVYNIETGVLLEPSPEFVIMNHIEAEYKEDAYDEHIDNMLETISTGDTEIIHLLKEMTGYTLYRSNALGKSFILKGYGGNGKSTLLEAIGAMLGNTNISPLSFSELNGRFNTGLLKDKLANIGDDIPFTTIKDTSIFKKATTGELIQGEVKGENPFSFKSYAKLIFSTNQIPKIDDNSNGLKDRIVIVPLNARIRTTEKDDPFYKEKVTTKSARNYLFLLAIEALRKLLIKKEFTIPQVVKDELEAFIIDNNPIQEWLESYEEAGNCIKVISACDSYISYHKFLEENGYKEVLSKKKFSEKMNMNGYISTRNTIRSNNKSKQVRTYVKNN